MKCIDPGHAYVLDHLDGTDTTTLRFVKRAGPGGRVEHHEGVLNQEVLRALVDRVGFLNDEKPWAGNSEILYHLRMALALHEARALLRKVERGRLRPECVPVGVDGHFNLRER